MYIAKSHWKNIIILIVSVGPMYCFITMCNLLWLLHTPHWIDDRSLILWQLSFHIHCIVHLTQAHFFFSETNAKNIRSSPDVMSLHLDLFFFMYIFVLFWWYPAFNHNKFLEAHNTPISMNKLPLFNAIISFIIIGQIFRWRNTRQRRLLITAK